MRKVVVVVAVLVVLGALGGGFYLIGPPAAERARRIDAHREHDLQRLRLAADLFWTRNSRLPASLDDLAKEAGTGIYSRDPDTNEPYEYRVMTPDRYQLCATFTTESEARQDFWSHGPGRRCFDITAKAIRP
jgi:hypothetical protein